MATVAEITSFGTLKKSHSSYSSYSGVSAPDPSRVNALQAEITKLEQNLITYNANLVKYKKWLDDCGWLNKSCKDTNKQNIANQEGYIATATDRLKVIKNTELPAALKMYNDALAAYNQTKAVEAKADPEIIKAQAVVDAAKEETAASSKMTLYLIAGGFGFMMVMVILIIALKK